jgi:hypothetical protein
MRLIPQLSLELEEYIIIKIYKFSYDICELGKDIF